MLHRFAWKAVAIAFVALLSACTRNSAVSIEVGEVRVSARRGDDPFFQTQAIQVADPDGLRVSAGSPDGASLPGWLDAEISQTDDVPWALTVWITDTTLPIGTYHAVIRITATTVDGRQLAFRDAVVTYVVWTDVQVTPLELNFQTAANGPDHLPTQQLALSGETGSNWSASADQSWVVLSTTSGTLPTTIEVGVNPSDLLVGHFTANVTFTDGDRPSTVPITLEVVAPALVVDKTSLSVRGAVGVPLAPQALAISMNNGTAITWTASTSVPWLVLSEISGTTPDAVSVSIDPSQAPLTYGRYSGRIDFSGQADGAPLSASVSVQLGLEAHTLEVIGNGVALTSTPSLSRLTRSLRVEDNLGLTTTPWTSTSNQSWLIVTPSGTTADPLTVTADPTGLDADTVHYATVTLSSSDASVTRTDTVQVGLWVGSTAPDARVSVAKTFTQVAADPVRPYVYVHPGRGATISAYNVYTGALVGSFTVGVNSGSQFLGAMTVSQDGGTLYVVVDGTDLRIFPVNLETGAAGSGWPIPGSASTVGLAYVRTKGVGAIVGGDGRVLTADKGALVKDGYYSTGFAAAASLQGRLACVSASCFTLDASTLFLRGWSVEAAQGLSPGDTSQVVDLAISNDGAKIYRANKSSRDFLVMNVANWRVGTLSGAASPNNVAVGPDGTFYGGASLSYYGPYDVWAYDSTALSGSSSRRLRLAGQGKALLDRQLTVSGDGLRLAALTSDPALVFATSP